MAVIEFESVTKRFEDVVAVDGLSFKVDQGNVVGFLGPNGAGKTTTLRMLLGLVAPSSGPWALGGRPVALRSRRWPAGRGGRGPLFGGGQDHRAQRRDVT